MADFVAGSVDALRMDLINIGRLSTGTLLAQGSTYEDVSIGNGVTEHITGFGVSYNILGAPITGTITGYQETYQGAPVFTATGLDVSAVTFYNWAVASDTNGALSTMLAGDDQITGSVFSDLLRGYAGNDYIAGGNGADTIDGGAGNDHIYGQSASGGPDGADLLMGGEGDDYIQGNAGNDTIYGGNGNDRLNGGADNDLIYGDAGDDTVNGNLGNDTIDGGAGNDFLRGGQGDDSIMGGAGNDVIMGDLGNDTISGGAGLDVMTGGAGSDLFKFAAGDAAFTTTGPLANYTDMITDFAPGTDKIALGFAPVAELTGSAASFTAALASAQSAFASYAGTREIAAIQVGSDTYVFWNGSGFGTQIDSALKLSGVDVSKLALSDFV